MRRAQSIVSVVLACLSGASSGAAVPVLYALGPPAEFHKGCYPPCQCAMQFGPLTGTFVLHAESPGPLFTQYELANLNFEAHVGTIVYPITGSGTFKLGGEFAYLQRMELDLSVNGGATQHFDSGWVPPGAIWPQIDVTVSINGMYCVDTVLDIVAAPVATLSPDLNGDGKVNGIDLGMLLAAWGPCPGIGCPADLTGDFTVDAADLSILLGAWTG
ncbi:MAG: hypothetical protein U0572_09250 [Phycisphaerales bacterium]